MGTLTLRGAMTALITPFSNGQIDEPALRALVDRQIAGKIDGLVPCGTTGEAATMSEDERVRVIEIVVDQAAGRVPIIAGTATNDTANTLKFTQRVSRLAGVDAALVVVPYYNKPNQLMMERHFLTVADEGGLPVVLYNVPGRTVVSLEPATIGRLARHEQIVAIKEATGDMIFATRTRAAVAGQDFSLLSGDDFTTMPFVALGGHGCISVVSNLDPLLMHEVVAATAAGELARARELNQRIDPLAKLLFARPNPVPTKEIAALLGWSTREVRAPMYPAEESFVAELRAFIQENPFLTDAEGA